MKIEFEVTAEDIANGVPGEVRSCPIALAIRRRLGPESYPYVDGDEIRFTVADRRIWTRRIGLPSAIGCFVANFDHKIPVKPFKFRVTISALQDQTPTP